MALSDSEDDLQPFALTRTSNGDLDPPKASSCSSDSEDSHPSHILEWLRGGDCKGDDSRAAPLSNDVSLSRDDNAAAAPSVNEKGDEILTWRDVNVKEILTRRRQDEELHARLDKVLSTESASQARACRSSSTEDGDLQYFLQKAKEMRILEPTVTAAPSYVIIDSKFSGAVFNHETLNISHFVTLDPKFHLPPVFSDTMEDINKILKLQNQVVSAKQEESICTFFFYLMSVHPSISTAEVCYEFLNSKLSSYCPHVVDFINVFRNWGAPLNNMYRTVPNLYTSSISVEFKICPGTSRQIVHHSISFVFDYMKKVVQIHSPDTYIHLLEPLMRLALDQKIHDKPVWLGVVSDIIHLLTRTKLVSLEDLHLKDLTLQNQTVLYSEIMRHAPCSIPLVYATLQQFLGKSTIAYTKPVDLETVHVYFRNHTKEILNSSCLNISSYVRLIAAFLFQREVGEIVCLKPVNYRDWIDLLSEWSRRITDSERSADPILLKEQISQVVYELRMNVAMKRKCQRDLSLMGLGFRSE